MTTNEQTTFVNVTILGQVVGTANAFYFHLDTDKCCMLFRFVDFTPNDLGYELLNIEDEESSEQAISYSILDVDFVNGVATLVSDDGEESEEVSLSLVNTYE